VRLLRASVREFLPALPFERSSVVVIGQVTDAQAYLSNDKTGVYSAFTVQITEVLKNSSRVSLVTSSSIEVERDGGRVRFPNGRLHIYKSSGQEMPKVGLKYVFFLMDGTDEPVFEILTGYELSQGKVYPLDYLPKTRTYASADEADFLRKLRNTTSP